MQFTDTMVKTLDLECQHRAYQLLEGIIVVTSNSSVQFMGLVYSDFYRKASRKNTLQSTQLFNRTN